MTQQDQQVRTTAPTQVRALLHLRRVAEILDRRPDLEGVYPPADLTAEAVRWSA